MMGENKSVSDHMNQMAKDIYSLISPQYATVFSYLPESGVLRAMGSVGTNSTEHPDLDESHPAMQSVSALKMLHYQDLNLKGIKGHAEEILVVPIFRPDANPFDPNHVEQVINRRKQAILARESRQGSIEGSIAEGSVMGMDEPPEESAPIVETNDNANDIENEDSGPPQTTDMGSETGKSVTKNRNAEETDMESGEPKSIASDWSDFSHGVQAPRVRTRISIRGGRATSPRNVTNAASPLVYTAVASTMVQSTLQTEIEDPKAAPQLLSNTPCVEKSEQWELVEKSEHWELVEKSVAAEEKAAAAEKEALSALEAAEKSAEVFHAAEAKPQANALQQRHLLRTLRIASKEAEEEADLAKLVLDEALIEVRVRVRVRVRVL